MMRRGEFIRGLLAAGAFAPGAGCRLLPRAESRFDENLSVFLADPHVQPRDHQRGRLRTVVSEILSMDPLPRNVVCFGDLARSFGKREDYLASRDEWMRLEDAGVRVTLGMGNHDRRRNFLSVWPEYATRTRVPGRIVTVTDLGSCDLLLFDSLYENHSDETRHCEGDGQLAGEQWEWIRDELPKWPRPVLVGSHHPVREFKDGDSRALNDLLMDSPNVIGYVHGHNHVWDSGLLCRSDAPWGKRVWKRSICLPSVGHWGDIGYVVVRTRPGEARADLVMKDHFFPNPDSRVWVDDEIRREKQGRFVTFRWGVLHET